MTRRYKHTTTRQLGGDDGYCWAVFMKGRREPRVCGLTRREVSYYRDRFEREEEAARQTAKESEKPKEIVE